MPFTFRPLPDIPDLILIEPRAFGDDRGWFMETWKRSEFEAHGITGDFVQDNHSRSTVRDVLRGLHYQMDPAAQGKLVRVLSGAIYDVAVDIRAGSPTYGKWAGVELTAEDRRMLWVPPGFAHGFCTITDISETVYKVTGGEYSPPHDRGIRWDDPDLAITWPTAAPILSAKDAAAPRFRDAENNFVWRRA